ncbi:MAG: glycosyltransferase, partial [Anaerolineaceae bacterium]
EKNIFSRNRIRYTLDRTAILLADCAAVSDKAGLYGFPAERIITFPWGVDLKTFRPGSGMDIRKKLGWAEKIILLSTRSMEKLYGCDILVDAFIDAATIDDRLCLLMLGDGSQKNQLMQKITSAGKNERVKFIGTIPETDITKYFQVSDVYISASHSDGSSVSLLQAMACGVAPLVSDIPGNREWVRPDHNGWLFEDGNSADLSVLMCQTARSPQLRSQYGKAARMFAQKRANWEVNSRTLGAAYKQAMNYQLGLVENSC